MYINSTGGSVFEGSAIYSQLKRHNAKVTVYIDGFACSIASVIAMAGDKVIMSENAVMMIHNAWAVAAGNSAQLRKIADDLDVINKANKAAYLVKSDGKITNEELTEMLDNETYLSAEDCVKYGFCDEISSKVESSVENHVEMLAYKNSIEKYMLWLKNHKNRTNPRYSKNYLKFDDFKQEELKCLQLQILMNSKQRNFCS